MSQVPVVINGRSYEVACGEGEEEAVARAGRELSRRVDELAKSVGQLGDTRLLLLAALYVTYELGSASGELKRLSDVQRQVALANSPDFAGTIDRLADRIEAIAAQLEAA